MGTTLRIGTFNIQHGLGSDGQTVDIGVTGGAVARLRADVLALQEVDVGVARSRFADQAASIAAATGYRHAFGQATRVGVIGRYGNALMTRGSIVEASVERLPRLGRNEPRAAIVAVLTVETVTMTVAATHLSVNSAEATVQLEAVIELLLGRPPPRLLLGDFNLAADEVRPVLEAAGFTLARGGPTFPASAPHARIDHVAVMGAALGAEEIPSTPASDHRPLIVEVLFP